MKSTVIKDVFYEVFHMVTTRNINRICNRWIIQKRFHGRYMIYRCFKNLCEFIGATLGMIGLVKLGVKGVDVTMSQIRSQRG